MFSGIVEEIGRVISLSRRGSTTRLKITATVVKEGTKIGDSISVNGACLSVVAIAANMLDFDLLEETRRHTDLGLLKAGDEVNLERSLKAGDRISGHFVLGHVDCIGLIRRKGQEKGNCFFEIALPQQSKFLVQKGSVAIEGISLTVAGIRGNCFKVYVIPHTLLNTTLGKKSVSSKVNVEFDVLLKRP